MHTIIGYRCVGNQTLVFEERYRCSALGSMFIPDATLLFEIQAEEGYEPPGNLLTLSMLQSELARITV